MLEWDGSNSDLGSVVVLAPWTGQPLRIHVFNCQMKSCEESMCVCVCVCVLVA